MKQFAKAINFGDVAVAFARALGKTFREFRATTKQGPIDVKATGTWQHFDVKTKPAQSGPVAKERAVSVYVEKEGMPAAAAKYAAEIKKQQEAVVSKKGAVVTGVAAAAVAAAVTSSLGGAVLVGAASAAAVEYIRNRKKEGAAKRAMLAGVIGAAAPIVTVYGGYAALVTTGWLWNLGASGWAMAASAVLV